MSLTADVTKDLSKGVTYEVAQLQVDRNSRQADEECDQTTLLVLFMVKELT